MQVTSHMRNTVKSLVVAVIMLLSINALPADAATGTTVTISGVVTAGPTLLRNTSTGTIIAVYVQVNAFDGNAPWWITCNTANQGLCLAMTKGDEVNATGHLASQCSAPLGYICGQISVTSASITGSGQ